MRCPFCSSRLRQVKSKSAILDVCPGCKGIWFDSGELADFVRTLSQSEEITAEKTRLFEKRTVQTLYDTREKPKSCPKCAKSLHRFNYSYDSNIFLDKCPACGGIWCDGGEVRQLAAYVKEDPRTTAVGRSIAQALATPDHELSGWQAFYFLYLPRVIIPVSDDTGRQRFPIVTISLIAFSILIFIARMFVNPYHIVEGLDFIDQDFFAIDLIASMFSQGGPAHLIWNMLFLWLFGDNVEDGFGRFGYLIFFLACALLASLFYLIFAPSLPFYAVGISAAVSAIMGAYFILYPAANIKIFVIYSVMEIPAAVCLGLWFLFQLMYPFFFKTEGAASGVCFVAVGGFVFGAVVACIKKLHA